MTTINPYLNFNGNTKEVFEFYRSVFGGEFDRVMRWKDVPEDMPGCENLTEADQEKIMHISLPLDDGNVLMGADALQSMGHSVSVGDNISLTIAPESKEETDRLFAALSEGGAPIMPPEDAFWGDYFGMCTDRYGIMWLLAYNEAGAGESEHEAAE